MKKPIYLIALLSWISLNSHAASENELRDIADCMAAFSISNSNMQLNGDHQNYKTGDRAFSKLMDVFYEQLNVYKKQNPKIDEAFLGQMPNRSLEKYNYMGDLQQLKYAQSVLKVNNCFGYVR